MKIDLDELERTARAATPGNWTTERTPNDADGWATCAIVAVVALRQMVYSDHPGGIAPEANRRYIAAASPPVVLALIARIRELEELARRGANCLRAKSDAPARRQWSEAILADLANAEVTP